MGGQNPLAPQIETTESQRARLEVAKEIFRMFALERGVHLALNAVTFAVLIGAAVNMFFFAKKVDTAAVTLVCGSGGLIALTSARLLQMWTDILNRVFGKL